AEAAQGKGLELVCAAEPAVPARVRGDPSRLRQVLLNLVSNAIKFTERGEGVVRVHRAADPRPARDGAAGAAPAVAPGGPAPPASPSPSLVHLRFEVADTGIGIPAQACERLFEPFTQVDSSTTRRYGGTGLGLAICQRLVTLMGGEIGVESEPGRGSCFWVLMPLKRVAVTTAPAAGQEALAGSRVLVISPSEAEPDPPPAPLARRAPEGPGR